MKRRKSPKKDPWWRLAWGVLWPVLLTYGVKLLLDLSLAAVTAQPIADHLPRFVLV